MADSEEIELLLTTFSCGAGANIRGITSSNGVHGSQHAAAALLAPAAAADVTAAAYYTELRRRISEVLQQRSKRAALHVLKFGMECLEGFVQRNLCGPIQPEHVPLWHPADSGNSSSSSRQQEAGIGRDTLSADERWVISQLEVDGEDLIGKVQGLDLLLAALLLLAEPCGIYTTAVSQQQQQQRAAAADQGAKGGIESQPPPPQQQQQQQPAVGTGEVADGSSGPQQQQQLDKQWLQQQGLGSWCWWALRAVMLQQQVLHGRCNTIQTAVKQLMQQTLAWADELQDDSSGMSTANTSSSNGSSGAAFLKMLAAGARVECAAVYQHFGQVQDAQQQLEAAAEVLGVTVEVTGALGFRTKHQLDAKPQLVAAVRGPAAAGAADRAAEGLSDRTAAAAVDAGVDLRSLGFDQTGLTKELEGTTDDSAVYLAPRLAAGAAAGSSPQQQQQQQQQQLSCMQQALLLGWASQIKKGTSKDELQQWQMAPFVEAVLQQQQTQYMLHATARLFKCRHEKERGRTRERSLMQLEQMCNALEAAQPPGRLRLPYVYALRFPLWPLLRKELAELYIGMGFVGAALRIFESLEMWDQLIVCYRLLDKRQQAQELVQQRLQVCPNDAKLWCVLGDIEQQDQHYIKAWEVSGNRSSRAQRSLARSALQRKEHQQAAVAYELALGLNPLYPDAWFSLGYCYLKLGEIRKALQAFTKVTQLEYDHGEAWTNLAALWLQEGGWSEALHASEQAVKYKRDSWQTWDNYATAAVKAGNSMAAVRALGQVFELTRGDHLSIVTAEQLMAQLEQEAAAIQARDAVHTSPAQPVAPPAAAVAAAQEEEDDGEVMEAPDQLLSLLAMSKDLSYSSSNATLDSVAASSAAAAARQRTCDQVMVLFGQLLKSVANSPACSPAVWGLFAKWYQLQGHLLSSQEAYLKQARALQSTAFKSDPELFATMAKASINLCRAYMASADAGQGGLRDLSSARMHLRGVLKQCEDSFEGSEQYKEMQALLQEVSEAEAAALAAKRAAEAPV